MVAASILPVAIHKGNLYFLFGKENQMEDSAKGFSDFGGGLEKNESILETAYREGSEELCGFLGDASSIKKLINGCYLKHTHENYHIHMFPMKYDENLPIYYTNNHHFVWNRIDKNILNDSKIFEKQEIRWFSVAELASKRNEFRSFYREIVDEIRARVPEIRKFILRNISKTRKNYSKNKTKRRVGGSPKKIVKSAYSRTTNQIPYKNFEEWQQSKKKIIEDQKTPKYIKLISDAKVRKDASILASKTIRDSKLKLSGIGG